MVISGGYVCAKWRPLTVATAVILALGMLQCCSKIKVAVSHVGESKEILFFPISSRLIFVLRNLQFQCYTRLRINNSRMEPMFGDYVFDAWSFAIWSFFCMVVPMLLLFKSARVIPSMVLQALRIANINRYSDGFVKGKILVIRRTCGPSRFKVVIVSEHVESMALWLDHGFYTFPFAKGDNVTVRIRRNSLHEQRRYCRAYTTLFVADVSVDDFSLAANIEIPLPNFINATDSKLSFFGRVIAVFNIEPTGDIEATGVVQNTQQVRVQVANTSVLCQLWNVVEDAVQVGDTLLAYCVLAKFNGMGPLLYVPYIRDVKKAMWNQMANVFKSLVQRFR